MPSLESHQFPKTFHLQNRELDLKQLRQKTFLHDVGALSMMSSDSQAMGRVGEVTTRNWQTADKMRKMKGPLNRRQ